MPTEYDIKGLDEVVKKLREMAPKLRKKALNASMRKGMAVVRKDASDRARQFDDPATKSQIWKEIVVRSNAKKARRMGAGTFLVQVGVKGGAKQYVNNRQNRRSGRVGQSYEGGGNVFHWRFLELGTKDMPARPFMRPALANNVSKVTEIVSAELANAIAKIAQGNA